MNITFDLKYAWRLLTKSWGYSLMCASVVALSVGLAVWTWTLAYSQIFRPLGFDGSERWYSVQIAPDAGSRFRPSVDAYTWQRLSEHNASADLLGAYAAQAAVLSEGEEAKSLRGAVISPRLLGMTRVPPLLGRPFDEADGRNGAAPAAILSYAAWHSYFAADPEIVGKTARINATPVRIVGVMPASFYLFQDFEVFLPLQLPKLVDPRQPAPSLSPLVNLRPGQTREGVAAELRAAVGAVNRDHPTIFDSGRRLTLVPANRMHNHGVTPIIAMLGLLAAGVLLLGCVNISMVFLARLLERSRELALRSALAPPAGG